jgi:prepilin-type processing-associated H-X9-DG protein
MLPYLDQAGMYSAIDFESPLWNQTDPSSGQFFRAMPINVLHCPSDSDYPGGVTVHGISWTAYAGNVGWDWWDRADEFYGGPFTLGASTNVRDIKDGTSTTIAVGEVGAFSFTGGGQRGGAGRPRVGNEGVFRSHIVATAWENTVVQQAANTAPYFRRRIPCPCLQADQPVGSSTTAGFWGPWAGPYAMAPLYVSHYGINSEWPGPSSVHEGGAHFLMADGAVRFINESIQMYNSAGGISAEGIENLYQALHSMHGHPQEDVISEF